MKKVKRILVMLFLGATVLTGVTAQEVSTGLDIYSSYIWRGAKFGTGPAFQPYVEYSAGGFALGAWGSVSAGGEEALEMDLYASYSFDFGLSLTVTDYYFGGEWLDFGAMHYIEPSIGFEVGNLSLTGAVMFLPGMDAAAAVTGSPASVDLNTGIITPEVMGTDAVAASSFGDEMDLYLEAAYGFGAFDLTLGFGDGQYTSDGEFSICNIGIGTSKEIKISDSFSLPVSGSVVLNPSTEGFFITVGISL